MLQRLFNLTLLLGSTRSRHFGLVLNKYRRIKWTYSLTKAEKCGSKRSKNPLVFMSIAWPSFFMAQSKDKNKPLNPREQIEVFCGNGDFESALQYLNECSLSPNDEYLRSCLFSYVYWKWALEGEDEEGGASTLVTTASTLFTRKDSDANPESEIIQQNKLSFSEKAQKSYEYAKSAFVRNPNNALTHKMMALSLMITNETFIQRKLLSLAIVIDHLEKSVQLDESDWQAHHYLGAKYLETTLFMGPLMRLFHKFVIGVPKKSLDEALHHLMTAELLSPGSSCNNLSKLAVIYYKKGDYEKSKLYLEQAVNFKCKSKLDEREQSKAFDLLASYSRFGEYYQTVKIE